MSTKLTLTIEESVIRRAKVYAKWKKTSISKLVEAYLDELLVMKLPNESELSSTPSVDKLAHLLTREELEMYKTDGSYKDQLTEALVEKYLKNQE